MAKVNFSDFNNKHFLALTGNIVMAAFGFVQFALLARSLPMGDLGVWGFFMTICALGDAARSSGFLSTATIKFYAGTAHERGQQVLGSVWFLAIIATGILVLLDMAFIPITHLISQEGFTVSIMWFGITFISSLPFTVMYWILQADERYDKILWLRLINYGPMLIYIIVLILLKKMTLGNLLWCNLLTNCLASIAGLLWGFGQVRSLFRRSGQCTKEIFHFGKYSMGSTFVSRLLGSTDTFLITCMLGNEMLAVYNVGLMLMQVIELIIRTFVGTGMSGMAIAYNNDNKHQVAYIMKKYSGMLIIAFIPITILVFVFADVAIAIVGGHKYAGTEAANLLRMFMAIALLYPLDRFIGATLDIIHKPMLNLYKVLIMLIFAITGDFVFISIFKNLYGVALACVFTTLSGIIFGYINLNKHLKVSLGDIFTLGFAEMKTFVQKMMGKVKRNR